MNGNVKVVEQLRLQFESGAPVELGRDGDVCAAASLLKLFLRELPERVITAAVRPRLIRLFQGSYGKSFWEVKQVYFSVKTKLLNIKYFKCKDYNKLLNICSLSVSTNLLLHSALVFYPKIILKRLQNTIIKCNF